MRRSDPCRRRPARRRATLLATGLGVLVLTAGFAGAALGEEPAAVAEPAGEARAPERLAGPFDAAVVLNARRLRGLRPEVAAQVFGGQPGGAVRLRAVALPAGPAGADGQVGLRLFVELDGASLVAAAGGAAPGEAAAPAAGDLAAVELYAYLIAEGGRVAAFLAEGFVFSIPTLGEAVWQSGAQYFARLAAAPGRYELRVLVRDRRSGASGLTRVPLEVSAAARPLVLVEEAAGRDPWIPIRGASIEDDDAGFPHHGRRLVPATLPVLTAGDSGRAVVLGAAPAEKVGVVLDGPSRRRLDVEVVPEADAAGGDRAVVVAFTPPPRLDPGVYDLRVELGDVDLPPVQVVLARPGSGSLRWTDPGLVAATTESGAPAVPWAESGTIATRGTHLRDAGRRREELFQGYRRVLAALGEGGGGFAARNALLELESGAALGRTLEALAEAEVEIGEWLAGREPEALVPVMELHATLYRVYRDRRRFELVVHSRDHVERLAGLYAERVKTTGAKVIAGRALASLAGYVQDANLPASSRRLYGRALELDPSNEAAALGLASSHEKYGDYPAAVAVLDRLLALRPSQVEARLRLAVNLFRTGRPDLAEKQLAALLESPGGGWVRALAIQEAARARLGGGDEAGAIALLEREVEEGPAEGGTVFLLAHLYDRRGEPARALELLSRVQPEAGSGPSPRKLYDSWPDAALGSMRRDLAAATESRTALLAAAFPAGAATPPGGSQVGGP